LEKLEKESQKPNFWLNQEKAGKISKEISSLKEEIENLAALNKETFELEEVEDFGRGDEKIEAELNEKCLALDERIKKEEVKTFFSGQYDRSGAILQVFSGAGGVDAQDWAAMVFRMYQRYCARRGFPTQVISQSFGEGIGPEGRIGLKSAIMEVKGDYAYGFLKKENGVHRLVRISPFSSQKLRHTSFALVEVLPEIKDAEVEVEIKPDELKIETYRASGPGGQYVNKTESAVRIVHIPTGISVSSQTERSQGRNKEKAMEIIRAKVYFLKQEEKKKEMKEIKGDRVSASWSNQIRNYVLHPYKLIKDLRTNVETSAVEKVLDGELEQFIEAEVKIQ
jgi:peptide chain release factor 2